LLFVVLPLTGAMALAAHSVVGEKQARTLEPLLATPITTLELLVAKVLGSLLPTLAVSTAGLAAYIGLIGLLAERGVPAAMVDARALVLVALVGPAAALVCCGWRSWSRRGRTTRERPSSLRAHVCHDRAARRAIQGFVWHRRTLSVIGAGSWRCGRRWRS
jgi:hypothetical protein